MILFAYEKRPINPSNFKKILRTDSHHPILGQLESFKNFQFSICFLIKFHYTAKFPLLQKSLEEIQRKGAYIRLHT